MSVPKSSTKTRSTKLRTSSTSCSTSRIATPLLLLHGRAALPASSAVSARSRPDDGSSRSTSLGSRHQRPADLDQAPDTETQRLDRRGRRPARGRAGRASPARARSRRPSGRPDGTQSFQSAPLPPRTRSATQEVLARRHAREQLDALERAGDAEPGPLVRRHAGEVAAVEGDRAAVGLAGCPSRQLKNVVLPAPLGPIRPTISPAPTSRLTSLSAVMPANRFVTVARLRAASRSGSPAGAATTGLPLGAIGRTRRAGIGLCPCARTDRSGPGIRSYERRFWNSRMPFGVLGVGERAEAEQDRLEPGRQRAHVVPGLHVVDHERDPRGQHDGLEEHEAHRRVDRAFDRARARASRRARSTRARARARSTESTVRRVPRCVYEISRPPPRPAIAAESANATIRAPACG